MIDFYDLTEEELAANGLIFGTPEDRDLFVRIISDELEQRIRYTLAKTIGKTNAEKFSLSRGKRGAARLESEFPECRGLIAEIFEDMSSEILKFKDRIAGIVDTSREERDDEMKLQM